MFPPTSPASSPRRSLCLSAVAAAAVAFLVGCSPTPSPSPTPTAVFASQDEAFAAAEQTFERYTEATNSTDLSNPETFDAVYTWLIGDALSSARENYSQFHAAGIERSGTSGFDTVTPIEYSKDVVILRLCLDVSAVQLLLPDGSSAVPEDRRPRQPLEVEFSPAGTPTSFAISSIVPTEALKCA